MTQASPTKPVGDSVAKVNDEVAVGEDLGFQRSWWRFERVMWAFFTFIIVLDLGGAFGRGPLAHARITSPDHALSVSYERIQRTGTPSMVSIELGPGAVRDGEATLFVSDRLVSALGAQRIIPQPETTRLGDGGFTYTFPVPDPPAIVRIELRPPGPGRFPFEISAGPETAGARAAGVPPAGVPPAARQRSVAAEVWVMP